jgi:hypothetical protein
MGFIFGLPAPAFLPGAEFFVHGGDATRWNRGGGMVLSCCRWHGPGGGKKAAAAIRPKTSPAAASAQKRMLKLKLKISRWTRTARKDGLKMFHRLQQGIGLPTDRWLLLAAKPGAKVVKPLAQFTPQPIE